MGEYNKLKQLIRRTSESQQLAATAGAQTGRAAGGAGADTQQGTLALDVVSYIYASVYDLLELMLFSNSIVGRNTAVAGGDDQDGMEQQLRTRLMILGRCLSALTAVARGDELHVFVASEMLKGAIQLRGPEHEAAQAGLELLKEAQLARYGDKLEEGTLLALMQASKDLAEEFL